MPPTLHRTNTPLGTSAVGASAPLPWHWDKMQEVYARNGQLSAAEFEQLFETTIRVGAIVGGDWSVTDTVLSVHRSIPLRFHYEALAAAMGVPFEGIARLHERGIDQGRFPAWTLNRTIFYPTPPRATRIGEMMLKLGLLSQTQLDEAVQLQQLAVETLKTKPALGSIARCRARISFPDFYQVLCLQMGIEYQGLDASAAHAFDALAAVIARG